MKPIPKNYFNAPSVLVSSLEAIERFQEAHKTYLKLDSEEAREDMAKALQTVKILQEDLAVPDEKADNIRVGFLKQVNALESNIKTIHDDGLYPDLYRDSETPFRLLNDILDNFKISLLSKGDAFPFIELSTSENAWKDYGVVAFCRDVTNNLKTSRFESLWDALQCYEKNKTQLTYTFEILSLTGNLGKQ
jgi:hypothetical protein